MQGVTIIPFRKGSKSLPNKALCTIGKETLLERTMRQAQWLEWPIVLFTDYDRIKLTTGENTRIIERGPVSDTQTTEEALKECIRRIDKYGLGPKIDTPDYICYMTVNTPVRKKMCLLNVKKAVIEQKYDSSFIVEASYKQAWGASASYGIRRFTSGEYEPFAFGRIESRSRTRRRTSPRTRWVAPAQYRKQHRSGVRFGRPLPARVPTNLLPRRLRWCGIASDASIRA